MSDITDPGAEAPGVSEEDEKQLAASMAEIEAGDKEFARGSDGDATFDELFAAGDVLPSEEELATPEDDDGIVKPPDLLVDIRGLTAEEIDAKMNRGPMRDLIEAVTGEKPARDTRAPELAEALYKLTTQGATK